MVICLPCNLLICNLHEGPESVSSLQSLAEKEGGEERRKEGFFVVSVQSHKHPSGTLLGARDTKMKKTVSSQMYSQASRGNRENQAMGQV